MNEYILRDILKARSLSFTREELQNMLDEELSKSPDDMDTELIERLLDVLSEYDTNGEKAGKAKKTVRLRRLIIIAAVIDIAVITMITSVNADFFNVIESEKIIRVFDDYITLDFSNGTYYDIEREFGYYKLGTPRLPKLFCNPEADYTESEKISDEEYRFSFTHKDSGISCSLTVTVTAEKTEDIIAKKGVAAEAEHCETVKTYFGEAVVYTVPDSRNVKCIYCVDGLCYDFNFDTDDFEKVTDIIC